MMVNGARLPHLERRVAYMRVSEAESMQSAWHAEHKMTALVDAARGMSTSDMKRSIFSSAFSSSSGDKNGALPSTHPAAQVLLISPKDPSVRAWCAVRGVQCDALVWCAVRGVQLEATHALESL